MTDVFDEIADDLRREKLHQFWKENGPWIIGGIFIAIVMTGVLSFWRAWEYKRDTTATAELTKVAMLSDRTALESYAKTAPADQAMIAKFMAAAAYADHNEKDKAVALYNEIAGTSGLDKTYRNLATLYSVSLRVDSGEPAQLRKELSDLTGDKAAWRYTALEMDALLAAKMGDTTGAVDALTKVTADPLAPADARTRAFTLRELYVAGKGSVK